MDGKVDRTRCVTIRDEVADALAAGRPVVALESTIIAHGLPRPDNLRVAREIEDAVRAGGAVPATIALLAGEVHVGLDDGRSRRWPRPTASSSAACATSRRRWRAACTGATTVAATAHLAARAGIRVFATGGLGGVHRGARETFDESADLGALARDPVRSSARG